MVSQAVEEDQATKLQDKIEPAVEPPLATLLYSLVQVTRSALRPRVKPGYSRITWNCVRPLRPILNRRKLTA